MMHQFNKKNIFVTGALHVGKSTIVDRVLERYANLKIGGFKTKPIFIDRERTGFTFQSLDGRAKVFAHTGMNSQDVFDIYRFDLSVFETLGVEVLQQAIASAELIIMDEIGEMEKNAAQFKRMILACLDSPCFILGAVQKRSTWFLDLISKRTDTDLIQVTETNRSEIPDLICFHESHSGDSISCRYQ
ncbi:MAG: nucleoside-triphosphatase [Candidatus Zhuqueibacterota bacterium]